MKYYAVGEMLEPELYKPAWTYYKKKKKRRKNKWEMEKSKLQKDAYIMVPFV
jgi:hypothetical protein